MSLKVGLALGGGGARGIAHIAYINALEELDIKPDIIAGTGIGALVGGLYASGKSPADIVELLEEVDYRKSMKVLNNYAFKDGKYGVLDHIGLEEYLELVMPVKIFDRLYTPLKVIAANYETKEQHIFEEGNVVSAIRASIAIPGIFSPVEVDEEFFIDGGCVNPLPIDTIREECDVLIAIDVTGKGLDSEISVASTANDLSQCYQILTKMLLQEKSKNNKIDILAAPELDSVQMLDVFNFENILEAVEDEVEDFKYEVAKLLKPELLEKAGTKPKKNKAEQEVEEVELEEEYNEEEYEEEESYDEEEYDEEESYDEEEYDEEEYDEEEYDEEEYDEEEYEEDADLVDENAEIAAQIAALEAKLKEAQVEEKKAPKAKKQGLRAKAKPAPKKAIKEEKPLSKRQAKKMAKKEALARLEQEILDELENR